MKKKIIIILILFIVGYILFKGSCLFYYNINNTTFSNYDKVIENFNINKTITIKTNKVDEYLNFNGIKIKNDFKNFEEIINKNDDKSMKKYKINLENKKLAAFFIGSTNTYFDLLKSDKDLYLDSDIRFKEKNIKKFLEDNKITNDIELFNFLRNYKYHKNTIFTSLKDMQSNFTIQYIMLIMIPDIKSISLIDGDYNGYIFNMKEVKEVSILKNNKRYILTFINTNYFTDSYIQDLLNSIVIE